MRRLSFSTRTVRTTIPRFGFAVRVSMRMFLVLPDASYLRTATVIGSNPLSRFGVAVHVFWKSCPDRCVTRICELRGIHGGGATLSRIFDSAVVVPDSDRIVVPGF